MYNRPDYISVRSLEDNDEEAHIAAGGVGAPAGPGRLRRLCARPVETPELALDYEYTAGTFPALGCSPSYAPLGEAVAAIMLGTTREEGAEAVSWAESSEAAWDALASGGTGVAVAADTGSVPSGVDAAPIARDALVFYVGGRQLGGLAGRRRARGHLHPAGRPAGGLCGEGEIEILARGEGSASHSGARPAHRLRRGLVTGESLPLTGDNVIGFGLWSECCLMGLADGYRLLSVGGAEPTARTLRPAPTPWAWTSSPACPPPPLKTAARGALAPGSRAAWARRSYPLRVIWRLSDEKTHYPARARAAAARGLRA